MNIKTRFLYIHARDTCITIVRSIRYNARVWRSSLAAPFAPRVGSLDDPVLSPHADGDGATCQVGCDADLNPFTKMMVEPALKGLFGQMADTLQARY